MHNETRRSALQGDDRHDIRRVARLTAIGAPENLARFRELYGFMSNAVRQPKRALHAVRTLGAIAVDMYRRQTNRPVREPFAGLEDSLFSPPLLPAQAFAGDRIVVVSGSLGAGGAERQAVNTIEGLRRQGEQDVRLICKYLTPGTHDFYLDRIQRLGVPITLLGDVAEGDRAAVVRRLRRHNRRGLRNLPATARQDIFSYAGLFHQLCPGTVHVWQDDTNIRAGIAAMLVGVPRIVLSCRSMAPTNFLLFQPYMSAGYRLLARLPKVALLNNSHAGAADYASWLGLPADRITVIPNGFDFAEFAESDDAAAVAWGRSKGLPPDAPVVGTILRFCEEKRPLLWIRAAAAVARRNAKAQFVMVGDGPMLGEARALAAALDLDDRLVFAGAERDVALALRRMSLFLLTSRLEGLPNVLIEAQGAGVPVVTTAGGGAPETLDHDRTGCAVASDDPEQLAAVIVRLLADEAWLAAARTNAPRFVQTKFALDTMIQRTLMAYGRGARSEFDRTELAAIAR
jgi:glycosyltransferase involved in cell wall biosynthesis